MSDNRKTRRKEEPQEEFVNDSLSNKDEKPRTTAFNEWSLDKLRKKAEEENIEDYKTLNREELIKELSNQ